MKIKNVVDDNLIIKDGIKCIVRITMVFALIFMIESCGTARKITNGKFDLTPYAGEWIGDDYIRTVNDQGDSVFLGSILTIDAVGRRIHLEYGGPPPMSRIVDLDTTIFMTGLDKGRFQFEDSWRNAGTGRIEFRDNMIVIDISINQQANSDWQIFEGSVSFERNPY